VDAGFSRTWVVVSDTYDFECIAFDLIEQFGDFAGLIARELAAGSASAQDDMLLSAETWRDVISALERLLLNYGRAQRLTIH
jgi:hypothetical protein